MTLENVRAEQAIKYTNIRWDEKGMPHSVAFDDKYFCLDDGYREAQHIFCDGNQLKERFEQLNQPTFVIGETGFGTGLNFLSAWEQFVKHAPSQAKLHYISIDQFPLNVLDLSKALSLWPELKEYSAQLIEKYLDINIQTQDVYFYDGRIRLTLIFDHVVSALARIKQSSFKVDAWFLDGFAPSKNSEMWSLEVFAGLSAVSQANTTIATFTVAGDVRRGLMQHGFSMVKAPGFGRKRQMLKGVYKG